MKITDGLNLMPENDAERVAALERYQIAGSERETAFDSICRLACELFAVPISHISFLDAKTEYIKAEIGLDGIESVGRADGFCAMAILQPEVMLIEDASRHPVLASHPYVTGEIMIRFYAAAPVITPDGFIIGTLCLIDQTPRGLSTKEQELLQSLAKVVMEQTELRNDNINLIEQRDKFIEVASHEMRTPLTALKAAAQLLQKKKDSNSGLIEQVSKSVEKLSGMINDMFDSARMQDNTFNLNRSAINLETIIAGSREHLRLTAKKDVIVKGDTDVELSADPDKIERVLSNLIQNGLKYAPGSPIALSLEKSTTHIKISISDQGPGIPSEKLPHIFRRYYRSDPSSVQTGLGLGLYISAEIVKQHGGEIGVESEPGKGCTFWFTLPIAV